MTFCSLERYTRVVHNKRHRLSCLYIHCLILCFSSLYLLSSFLRYINDLHNASSYSHYWWILLSTPTALYWHSYTFQMTFWIIPYQTQSMMHLLFYEQCIYDKRYVTWFEVQAWKRRISLLASGHYCHWQNGLKLSMFKRLPKTLQRGSYSLLLSQYFNSFGKKFDVKMCNWR